MRLSIIYIALGIDFPLAVKQVGLEYLGFEKGICVRGSPFMNRETSRASVNPLRFYPGPGKS